jgi:large subunit ribosomal protein L6
MSRIAKIAVVSPTDVSIKVDGQILQVKGSKGSLAISVNSNVRVIQEEAGLAFAPRSGSKHALAMSGTTRSLVNNMVVGVSEGFAKTLLLQGVGYRAVTKSKVLSLTLGFSHPVEYSLPEGISAECPNQTTVVISGIDKQQVGQVAAEIRAFRPPEPYKGKGVRYSDEYVHRKEAKKK